MGPVPTATRLMRAHEQAHLPCKPAVKLLTASSICRLALSTWLNKGASGAAGELQYLPGATQL